MTARSKHTLPTTQTNQNQNACHVSRLVLVLVCHVVILYCTAVTVDRPSLMSSSTRSSTRIDLAVTVTVLIDRRLRFPLRRRVLCTHTVQKCCLLPCHVVLLTCSTVPHMPWTLVRYMMII
jgi:hypothetical protein